MRAGLMPKMTKDVNQIWFPGVPACGRVHRHRPFTAKGLYTPTLGSTTKAITHPKLQSGLMQDNPPKSPRTTHQMAKPMHERHRPSAIGFHGWKPWMPKKATKDWFVWGKLRIRHIRHTKHHKAKSLWFRGSLLVDEITPPCGPIDVEPAAQDILHQTEKGFENSKRQHESRSNDRRTWMHAYEINARMFSKMPS